MKKHKFRPLDGLYGHGDVPLKPKVESEYINKFMNNFPREASHVKVKSWTRKITAAPSVSNKHPERVTSESKKQIIGLPKVYLREATVPQALVNDHSPLGSCETTSVCPRSCFEDVSDCQYDDSSCINKDNGESMRSNDCIGDIDGKNVMSSVNFSGSSAPLEAFSSRNELSGAKDLASECTKEPMECDVSMKLEAGCHDGNSSATDSLKGCDENEHLKYNSSIINMQNTREPSVQGQTVGDTDGPDELVDVRVCDICGDVGREALLALCSKCSDGAEHIYCMRIKMDTVPDGNWMCEECTGMQEPKRQKVAEADRSDRPSNQSRLEEVSRNLVKKDSGVQHADENETRTKISGKTSSLSGKRPGSDIVVGPVPKRRIVEGSVQSLKSSGCSGKSQLSRLSSVKNMSRGKYEAHQVSSFSGQNTKKVMEEACSPPGHRSLKLGSDRKVKAALKSGNLEKSVQPLNNTMAGGKSQLTRVSSMKIGDKGNKLARKACSFGHQSAKEVVVEQLYSPRGQGSPRPQEQFRGGKLSKSKSINIPDSNKEVRCQSKDTHPDGPAKESSGSPLNKKCPERKLLKSMSFSGGYSVSPNVSNARFSHTKQDLRHGNGRNSTKKCDSPVSRSSRFGPHVAAPDGMKVNTHRTKVGSDSPHLLRNNVQEMKAIQENGKSNLSKEENGKSNVKPCEPVAYQGQTCASTSVARSIGEKTLPTSHSSAGIRSPAKNVSSYPHQKANQSPQKTEIECLLGVDKGHLVASHKAPTIDLHPMKEMHTFTPTAVVSSGVSAVPESEFIWKGAFKLEKDCKLPKECSGIQAHLSTCASSKVANLVNKFHPKLLLKEVSRLDTWPIQFQRNLPTEEDIGVYFFAEDLASYSRSYKMVLEGMIENDLALEADFDGVQLLVFPSSLLPVRSQRWNTLSFLWGVFRVRKVDNSICHKPSLNIPKLNQGALDPMLFQSSASTKSMDQSFKHEVAPLDNCLSSQGTENVLFEAGSVPLADDLIKKERLPSSVLCDDDNKKDNEYASEEPKGLDNPCTIPPEQPDGELGENVVYLAVDPDAGYKAPSLTSQVEKRAVVASGSSFSVDSGPSGSSDGVGCAKLDEGQVEQSQNPKNFDLNLNLDLSLGTTLEREGEIDLNLDLVLGFPQTNYYQPELCPKDSSKDGNNNLLVLSLGMPC